MRHLPNLRHLGYLVALAEHLHFGRAAEASAVTQSTLSAGIKELEAVFGIKVAERTKRSVILTPAGLKLAGQAKALLRAADDMLDTALEAGAPLSGTVELGTIPTIGPYLLPRILPALKERFPHLKFSLREDKTSALLERLGGGRTDLVLMAFPYETGHFERFMLFDDAYRFACATGSPLAAVKRVKMDTLNGEPLLLLERDHCLHSHALPLLEEASLVASPTFSATSLPTLVAMVGEGMGATLLPDLAINAGLAAQSQLVIRPIEGEPNTRTIGLCWRRQSGRAETFRRLGEALKAWAAEEVQPWNGVAPG